jgi:hypothetical protein
MLLNFTQWYIRPGSKPRSIILQNVHTEFYLGSREKLLEPGAILELSTQENAVEFIWAQALLLVLD